MTAILTSLPQLPAASSWPALAQSAWVRWFQLLAASQAKSPVSPKARPSKGSLLGFTWATDMTEPPWRGSSTLVMRTHMTMVFSRRTREPV